MGYEFLFDIFFLTSGGSGWVAVGGWQQRREM